MMRNKHAANFLQIDQQIVSFLTGCTIFRVLGN